MRCLVLWADDRSPNLGVRVLAQGAGKLISKATDGNAEVIYQDFRPDPTGRSLDRPAVLREISRRTRSIHELIDSVDVVLDTGAGDSFTDLYGVKRLMLLTYVRSVITTMRKPLILLPQTVGPFHHGVSRVLARRTVDRCTALMVRDSASAEQVVALSRTVDVVSSDMVFALEQPAKRHDRDVLLNISGLLWNGGAGIDASRYQSDMINLYRGLVSAGRSVTLLAHVLDNEWADNDVAALHQFRQSMDADVPCVIPVDLRDAREIISGAAILVGARMHACLNALSMGVPALPLAYSRKFAPLLSDLGWPFTIDLRDENDLPRRVLSLSGMGELATRAREVRERGTMMLDLTTRALHEYLYGGSPDVQRG